MEIKYFEGLYFSGLFNPTINENYFMGNHNFWDENFNSKFINQIDFKLKLSNDYISFYPDVSFSSIKNYIYFDESKLPKQNQNTIYKNSFTLSFDLMAEPTSLRILFFGSLYVRKSISKS